VKSPIRASIFPLLCSLFVSSGLSAEESRSPFTDPNYAAPSIWRVQGKGADLYLMGSVHVGHGDGWRFSKSVVEHFENAEVVVVELDIRSREASKAIREAMDSHSRLESPQSLKTLLPADVYAKLQTQLAAEQLFPGMFEQGKPWLVANVLATKKINGMGYSTKDGVEMQLLGTMAPNQAVETLEPPDSHVLVFERLSPDQQVLMLRDTLYRVDEMGPYLERLLESWRRGDDEALEKTVFESLREHPELAPFYEVFFFERNREMAKKLARMADGKRTTFAMIGAGHLVGEKGVVEQLRKQGYQVGRLGDP